MRKDELIAENKCLKEDLKKVCECHLKLIRILDNKISENAQIKEKIKQ